MALTNFSKVAAIVAHPDDEVLGCGGLLFRAARWGAQVHVLILSGVTTSREHGDTAVVPRDETSSAMRILGVTHWKMLGYPDNRFDTVPFLDLVKQVEAYVSSTNPDLVLTHDGSDLNLDHRLVHQAVLTACRPTEDGPHTLYGFETLSSSEWQDPSLQHFRPTIFVDISAALEAKLAAMDCYRSELRAFPHPRSIEGVRIRAAQRGMEVRRPYAEAFRLIRQTW